MATTDFSVAVECAKILLSAAVLESSEEFDGTVSTVGELTRAYLDYADEYYKGRMANLQANRSISAIPSNP